MQLQTMFNTCSQFLRLQMILIASVSVLAQRRLVLQECNDIIPDGNYSCIERVNFGQCSDSWMLDGNFCAASCARCSQQDTAAALVDKDDSYHTANLTNDNMSDNSWQSPVAVSPSIVLSFNKVAKCGDTEPDEYSCKQVKQQGHCEAAWVTDNGLCQLSCGQCQEGLETKEPDTDQDQGRAEKLSLVEERTDTVPIAVGKENESSDCIDIQPPNIANCTKQMMWGRCNFPILVDNGYCARTCDRCMASKQPPQQPPPTDSTTLQSLIEQVEETDTGEAYIQLVTEKDDNIGTNNVEQTVDITDGDISAAAAFPINRDSNVELNIIVGFMDNETLIDDSENATIVDKQTQSPRNETLTPLAGDEAAKTFSIDDASIADGQDDGVSLTSQNVDELADKNTTLTVGLPSSNSTKPAFERVLVNSYTSKVDRANTLTETDNVQSVQIQPSQVSIFDNGEFLAPIVEIETPILPPKSLPLKPQTIVDFVPIKQGDVPPPNFLIIMTDDQGYDDIGYHHRAGILKTPNMDRFARQSVEFSNFYTDSLCAPTRASQMTGRHHLKTGVWGVHAGMDYIDLSEELIAEPLLRAGYKTSHFGKWHSGTTSGYTPWDRGFEEAVNAHLYVFYDNIVMHNGVPEQTSGWVEEVLADRIIQQLTERAEDGLPFFINWTPMSIHQGRIKVEEEYEEWVAPQKWIDMYEGKVEGDLVKVFASISYFDSIFGKVIGKLDELGLADDTVVMFFGDNGPHLLNTDHHEPGASRDIRVSSHMYEEKGFIDENGVRNFFFARMNGTFPPGLVVDSNIYVADVFPTVMEFAGAQPLGNKSLDGYSFAPLLLGQNWEYDDRRIFFHEVLKNTIVENVVLQLGEERTTNKSQALLNYKWGATDGEGLMRWTSVRLNNYKYIKNHTYDIQLGDHIEWWEYRIQYTQPELSDAIYDLMYSSMENWWQNVLEEPTSFQKPIYLVGHKEESVSDVLPYGAHEVRGIKVSTHNLSGFRKIGDYAVVKIRVETEGLYELKLNYGWTEWKGAVIKATIGTWEEINSGAAPYATATINKNGRSKMNQIYLQKTPEDVEFVEMKLTLISREKDDGEAVFSWLNLIEFFLL